MGKKKEIQKKSQTNEDQETLVLDFSFPTSLVSVKINGFNNYMKDDNEAFHHINFCLNELSTLVAQATPANLYQICKGHYHKLDDDKLLVFEKAVIEAYLKLYPQKSNINAKNFYDQNFKETAIYQLGLQGGIRLLGYLHRKHHFKVVLIDYHHTLYPSVKYNQDDIDRNNVCFYERGHYNGQ